MKCTTIARAAVQPLVDHGGLVGPLIVQYEAVFEIGRDSLVDGVKKLLELDRTMFVEAAADDLPGGDVRRSEQRGGAVPPIVMGLPWG